jgi:predicted aconitase
MTTKFKVKFLSQYLSEIFGSNDVSDPLLIKNLSQKTKFNLKKLGASLQDEHKLALDQVKELFNEHSEEIPLEPGEERTTPKKRIKESSKEEFPRAVKEIEDMYVEIEHAEFVEKDFLDRSTGEIIAGTTYYNLIDILLRWEPQEQLEEVSQHENNL